MQSCLKQAVFKNKNTHKALKLIRSKKNNKKVVLLKKALAASDQ